MRSVAGRHAKTRRAGGRPAAVPVLIGACLVAASLTAVFAATAPATSSAAAATSSCKPVWFIGARGSGETATGDAGMGKEVYYLESAVAGDLKVKGLSVASMAVDYPADSVDELKPNSTVIADLKQGATAAAIAAYLQTSVSKYDASMTQGIKQAEADVAAVVSSCPNAKIIMGGYSQGAVAVHDAENWLVNNEPAEFKHIAGTLLLGDPDRVPNTKAKKFGDSAAKAEGLRVYLKLVKAHDVPAPATAANIADTGDMVGDFQGIPSIENSKADTAVHSGYETSLTGKKLLKSAADWLAGTFKSVASTPATTTWKATAVPVAAKTNNGGGIAVTQVGISCPSSTFCVAVGGYGSTDQGSLLTWSNGKWTAAAAPVPANQFVNLGRVSCPSATFCVAAGMYDDLAGTGHGILLTWSGGKWTMATVPVPANASGTYSTATGVSCASASFCTASGAYNDTSGSTDGLLLTRSGGVWKAAEARLPTGAATTGQNAYMEGISCASASFCTGVGVYDDTAGAQQGLLLSWSGGAWTAATKETLPGDAAKSGQVAFLNAVSCPTTALCIAVGNYGTSSGSTRGLLLTRSGGAWKTAVAPLPDGASSDKALPSILDVSCASASSSCVAGGEYHDTSDDGQPLLLTLSDGAWTSAKAPVPAGSATPAGELVDGVSCPTASFCAADGYYTDTSAAKKGVFLTR